MMDCMCGKSSKRSSGLFENVGLVGVGKVQDGMVICWRSVEIYDFAFCSACGSLKKVWEY